jgi:hypothetical protein
VSAALCWCGVIAIGRCRSCNRAFCRSHQGIRGLTFLVDECAECGPAEERRRATEQAELRRAAEEQRVEQERRLASLPRLPGGEIAAFIRGELPTSGQIVRVRDEEFAVRQLPSTEVADAVRTLRVPGPFKHALHQMGGKKVKVRGWVFCTVTRTSDPDKVGDWINSKGLLLTTSGGVSRFDLSGDHSALGSQSLSYTPVPAVSGLTLDDLLLIRVTFNRARR